MRNVFLDTGDMYQGNADVAVNAGFFNGAQLSDAKHSIYYAWSECRDAMRRYRDVNRLEKAARGTKELEPGVHLGEQTLVFDNIAEVAGDGDYRSFAEVVDRALKEWDVIPKDAGYVGGKLISDTKEIVFDPEESRFSVQTLFCGYFSGAPDNPVKLSDDVCVISENDRITLSLIAKGGISSYPGRGIYSHGNGNHRYGRNRISSKSGSAGNAFYLHRSRV